MVVGQPMVTKDSDAPLKFLVYQPTIMGITAQNMTSSNSILSPTKSMVARGNQL